MTSNPHDRLVKKVLSTPENAAGELRSVLPAALTARIDWSTLRLEPGSFVNAKARERHTDLLFSAEIGDGDRRVCLYVLIEHQSTVDRWMVVRVLDYMGRIWTRLREKGWERLPIVVPLILFNGESGWTAATQLSELLDADEELLQVAGGYVPDFELLVDDLARVPEVALVQRPMSPLAKLALWALRAVRVGFDPERIGEWAAELSRAHEGAGREAAEVIFVYLSLVDGGSELYQRIIDADVTDEVREVAMGLRKEWEDKARREGETRGRAEGEARGRAEGEARGRAEGEARGRAEGEARGRAELLLKQLRLKFGELPESAVQRVRSASTDELDRWAERVLTAESLDELWG